MQFFYNKGKKIGCIFKKKSPSAIIMCHGFGSDKNEHGFFSEAEKIFFENGFSVMRFDFRGHGESNGFFEGIHGQASDLREAIKFCKKRGIKKIFLLAMSLGSAAVVFCAKRAEAIALLNPAINIRHCIKKIVAFSLLKYLFKRRIKISKTIYNFRIKFGKSLEKEYSINLKREIKNMRNLMIVQSKKDRVVSMKDSKKAYALAREPKRIEAIKKDGHVFSRSREKVIAMTLEWFLLFKK